MTLEARRVTGPGWLLSTSGAAIEVPVVSAEIAEHVAHELQRQWQQLLAPLQVVLPDLAWPPICQWHSGEATLAFAVVAPWDVLDLAVQWLEAIANRDPLPNPETDLRRTANPALRAWLAHCHARGVPVLVDDERITCGFGPATSTVDVAALPDPDQLPTCSDFPISLVTGTNGKTTTSRLLARMLQNTGLQVGCTGTDGWAVGDSVQDPGDWTGPGGARQVLRHPVVQAAVLETARGGLLRRGLALAGGNGIGAQVAAVTSLASDHLGEWGVDTLADLAAVKLAVVQGVRDGGWLVLHAGSPALVIAANNCRPAWQARDLQVLWFAEQTDVAQAVAQAGDGLAYAAQGQLWWQPSATTPAVALLPETDVALGLAATARHNLDNALAAAAMALLQGVAVDVVRQTLRTFGTLPTDNPGRLSCWQLHGALVLLDFAHNPQGMQRIVQFAQALVVKRRLLVFGQAGDRSLSDLRALVDAAIPLAADGWLIKDTLHYLRGRKTGEVPEILRGCLVLAGIDPATITRYPEESSAVAAAMAAVQSGDLLILLIHDDAAAATAQLQAAGAVPWTGPLPVAATARSA